MQDSVLESKWHKEQGSKGEPAQGRLFPCHQTI